MYCSPGWDHLSWDLIGSNSFRWLLLELTRGTNTNRTDFITIQRVRVQLCHFDNHIRAAMMGLIIDESISRTLDKSFFSGYSFSRRRIFSFFLFDIIVKWTFFWFLDCWSEKTRCHLGLCKVVIDSLYYFLIVLKLDPRINIWKYNINMSQHVNWISFLY